MLNRVIALLDPCVSLYRPRQHGDTPYDRFVLANMNTTTLSNVHDEDKHQHSELCNDKYQRHMADKVGNLSSP